MKKIIYFILMLPIITLAQKESTSPYSNFGYGESKFNNSTAIQSMAGTGTAYVSPFANDINISNPAGTAFLQTTVFEMDFNSDLAKYKSNGSSEDNGANYLSNISLALPLGKRIRLTTSFQPFSATGFNLKTTNSDGDTFVNNTIEGDGGINTILANLSYRALKNKNLAVGATVSYLFGTIDQQQKLQYSDQLLTTEYLDTDKVKGINVGLGAIYRKKLPKDKFLNLGASVRLAKNLDNSAQRYLITYAETSSGRPITSTADTIQLANVTQNFKIPLATSFAVGYEKPKYYGINLQYDFEKLSDFNAIDSRAIVNYDDKQRVALGGYYIPKYNSASSYFKLVTYRGGIYYEKTGLNVSNGGNSENINAYGLTFGLGLPVGKDKFSNLNIGVDLGQKGTDANGLVKENYAKIKIGFVINSNWFAKRVYN